MQTEKKMGAGQLLFFAAGFSKDVRFAIRMFVRR